MEKEQNILKLVFIGIAIILATILFWYKPNEPFQVLAIIGSLSWLSILSDLLIRFFINPNIEIIPDNDIEIGYTTNGPIINPQVAFISENKSSLIKNIVLELIHENNDTHSFSWEWFEETLYEVTLPERNIPTRKNQKAVAIKIKAGEMVEKKIGFHSNTFKNEFRQKLKETNQKYINVFQQETPNPESFTSSNEYNALIELYSNSFIWRIGKYKMKYKVFILNRDKPFEKDINFELSSIDIRTLNNNISKCLRHIEITYGIRDDEIHPFDWIYTRSY